jgi:plasmid rolling circle replication initiator protein Rep
MDNSTGESVPVFLIDLLPIDEKKSKKGKKPKQNWDTRKDYTVQVADLLNKSGFKERKLSARIYQCANVLNFAWVESTLKFKAAWFCRVRTCPICQWRRSQMLLARFFEAYPRIKNDYPTVRYVFLTLTVKNCPVNELRATVQHMGKAWDRLAKRKAFPAIGFVRSLEVTKETDTYDKKTKQLIHKARPNYAHPHFHILLALKPSYFVGRNYLSTEKWSELWQDSLKVDYKPVCDIRIVKASKFDSNETDSDIDGIKAAIVEVIKYTVKPSDMVHSGDFLTALVEQLHKLRAVTFGGIFKDYLAEVKECELDGDTPEQDDNEGLYFGWRSAVKRYQQLT